MAHSVTVRGRPGIDLGQARTALRPSPKNFLATSAAPGPTCQAWVRRWSREAAPAHAGVAVRDSFYRPTIEGHARILPGSRDRRDPPPA